MTRVGSVVAHGGIPSRSGGSTPAPTLHFWVDVGKDEAISMVEKHHYSARWPAAVQMVVTAHRDGGLFGNRGEAVAAVVYTIPPTRWSVDVWELARLVRLPTAQDVQLSGVIAASVRAVRKHQGADLLVSFADVQQGHHGGVYQASGWFYDGQRAAAMEGITVDGQFIPGRSANHRFGTRSPAKLADMGVSAEAKWDEGKHLYWRPVSKTGASKASGLGLKQCAYPKPKVNP